MQTRIRGSHGVIVLASKNSPASTGQKWEVDCAKAERKPILGIQAYTDDYTAVPGVTVVPWTRQTIADFIDRL